jgi:fucose permease
VGVPTAVSELIGGVLMPVVAGGLADTFGLGYPMLIVGCVSLVSAFVGMFLDETVPAATSTHAVSNVDAA